MEFDPPGFSVAHIRNMLAAFHGIAFSDTQSLVVRIGTQEALVVLDDNKLAVSAKSTPAIDNPTRCRGIHGLSASALDIDAFATTFVEQANHLAPGWPAPFFHRRTRIGSRFTDGDFCWFYVRSD